MTMKTCKTCKQSKIYDPTEIMLKCNSPYMIYDGQGLSSEEKKIQSQSICYGDHEGYMAFITVGPEFGCIHWEAK